jgi:DNA-binding PadR family transcriptional regulator
MDFSQDLQKGSFVPIILSLLRERAMYGYEMVKLVDARTGGRLQWREGTLYPTLHRLEAEKLIESRWQDVPGCEARQRKYYHITRKGLAELARRVGEWKEFTAAVNAIVLGG